MLQEDCAFIYLSFMRVRESAMHQYTVVVPLLLSIIPRRWCVATLCMRNRVFLFFFVQTNLCRDSWLASRQRADGTHTSRTTWNAKRTRRRRTRRTSSSSRRNSDGGVASPSCRWVSRRCDVSALPAETVSISLPLPLFPLLSSLSLHQHPSVAATFIVAVSFVTQVHCRKTA